MSGRSINFKIVHEIKGRMRISLFEKRLTLKQADMLQYYLLSKKGILTAKIYERTADAAIEYRPDVVSRADVLAWLHGFSFQDEKNLELIPEHTGRELNIQYKEKLVGHVLVRCATRLLLPAPLRRLKAVWNAVRFIKMGIRCLAKGRLEVPVLDAAAIGVSLLRGDYDTASSVMFLLKTGELLEEWTHKKSVADSGWETDSGGGFVRLRGRCHLRSGRKYDSHGRRGGGRRSHGKSGVSDGRSDSGEAGGRCLCVCRDRSGRGRTLILCKEGGRCHKV